MLMEDTALVQEIIDKLEREAPGGWTTEPGYFAFTGFEFNNGSPRFNPLYGVPVKIFTNRTTGEVRTYGAEKFERDM
jgi:hypothetical protein